MKTSLFEAWLRERNVCPVSGRTLSFEDLKVDAALKRRIQEHHIKEGLMAPGADPL